MGKCTINKVTRVCQNCHYINVNNPECPNYKLYKAIYGNKPMPAPTSEEIEY